MADQDTYHSASGGGLAAKHATSPLPPFTVGPSTADEFNRFRLPLITTFCCRIEDVRFATSSSFVSLDRTADADLKLPGDIRSELRPLAAYLKKHPGCPLTVFGHAETLSSDDESKTVSGRRATAVYAVLIANTSLDKAAALWNQLAVTEQWGSRESDAMQEATGLHAGASMSQLIRVYLQKLCPKRLHLSPHDFLAKGTGTDGKGDYQGCSGFNPLLVLSEAHNSEIASGPGSGEHRHAVRRRADAPNRRVLILVFRKGTRIDPAQWPCPSVAEGTDGCRKRFFPNGEDRRSMRLAKVDRRFNMGNDTFACRFYHLLLRGSPCEGAIELSPFSLRLIDELDQPMARQKYRLTVGSMTLEGVTADDGSVRQSIPAGATTGTLLLPDKKAHLSRDGEPEPWKLDLQFVELEPAETVAGYQSRLDNLGFFTGKNSAEAERSTRMAVQRFQAFYEVHPQKKIPTLDTMKDTLDDATLKKLKEVYGDAKSE